MTHVSDTTAPDVGATTIDPIPSPTPSPIAAPARRWDTYGYDGPSALEPVPDPLDAQLLAAGPDRVVLYRPAREAKLGREPHSFTFVSPRHLETVGGLLDAAARRAAGEA